MEMKPKPIRMLNHLQTPLPRERTAASSSSSLCGDPPAHSKHTGGRAQRRWSPGRPHPTPAGEHRGLAGAHSAPAGAHRSPLCSPHPPERTLRPSSQISIIDRSVRAWEPENARNEKRTHLPHPKENLLNFVIKHTDQMRISILIRMIKLMKCHLKLLRINNSSDSKFINYSLMKHRKLSQTNQTFFSYI